MLNMVRKLWVQVLVGIFLGAVLGGIVPEWGAAMKPLGDFFIALVKMIICPIIFCTVVTGIVHMGDMKGAGRLGFKALIYFEVMTTVAMVLGLIVGNLTGMGSGMDVDPAALTADGLPSSGKAHGSLSEFLLGVVPHSFLGGLAEGNVLQTLTAAILFSFAALGMGEKAAGIVRGIDSVSHIFFRIVGIVMTLAPLGAFGAMAYTIGKFGLGSLIDLFVFVGWVYATSVFFVLAILGAILYFFTGLSIFGLIRYIRDELLIVFGTSSSESVLPRIVDRMEQVGCERQVVGMVVPTGYAFNLDGSSLYFTMAVMFLANAMGMDLSLGEQISILLVLLLTSKGAAGVVGSAFIALVATLEATNKLPLASAALIYGVDRFLSISRALTNLVGNCVATLTLAKMEGALDIKRAEDIFAGRIVVHSETDVDEGEEEETENKQEGEYVYR